MGKDTFVMSDLYLPVMQDPEAEDSHGEALLLSTCHMPGLYLALPTSRHPTFSHNSLGKRLEAAVLLHTENKQRHRKIGIP